MTAPALLCWLQLLSHDWAHAKAQEKEEEVDPRGLVGQDEVEEKKRALCEEEEKAARPGLAVLFPDLKMRVVVRNFSPPVVEYVCPSAAVGECAILDACLEEEKEG